MLYDAYYVAVVLLIGAACFIMFRYEAEARNMKFLVSLGAEYFFIFMLVAAYGLSQAAAYDNLCLTTQVNTFPLAIGSGGNYLNTNSALEVFATDRGSTLRVWLGSSINGLVLVANESFGLVGALGTISYNTSIATVVPQGFYYRANYTAANFNGIYLFGC